MRILRETGRGVLLVPHVFYSTPYNDDPGFLRSVSAAVQEKTGRALPVLSAQLSASELKWMIARCAVFAGCRTHSTIAALSSGVPTLSLACSTKAVTLTLQPAFALASISVPPTLTSGQPASVVVRLIGPAPAGGVTVALWSSRPDVVEVPQAVVVVAGAVTAEFTIGFGTVSQQTPVTISASAAGITKTAVTSVVPGG